MKVMSIGLICWFGRLALHNIITDIKLINFSQGGCDTNLLDSLVEKSSSESD